MHVMPCATEQLVATDPDQHQIGFYHYVVNYKSAPGGSYSLGSDTRHRGGSTFNYKATYTVWDSQTGTEIPTKTDLSSTVGPGDHLCLWLDGPVNSKFEVKLDSGRMPTASLDEGSSTYCVWLVTVLEAGWQHYCLGLAATVPTERYHPAGALSGDVDLAGVESVKVTPLDERVSADLGYDEIFLHRSFRVGLISFQHGAKSFKYPYFPATSDPAQAIIQDGDGPTEVCVPVALTAEPSSQPTSNTQSTEPAA